MIKTKSMTVLLLILMCVAGINCTYGEAGVVYYPIFPGYQVAAKDCEKAIRNNSESVIQALHEINRLYTVLDFKRIDSIKEQYDLEQFDSSLIGCSAAFEFSDGGDYFGVAHSYLSLVLRITEEDNQLHDKVDIHGYIETIVDSLSAVNNSTRR